MSSPITKGAPGYVSRDDPEAIERVHDAVADRFDGDTIAALPADVADDLPPEKVDEAAHLLQEIAEQKREGEAA